MGALYKGLIWSALISAVAFYPVTMWMITGSDGRAWRSTSRRWWGWWSPRSW
jgi:hypothetical protein